MKVATPLLLMGVWPRIVVPSSNVTTPVKPPRPEIVGFTVAVNVTGCPNEAGPGDDVSVVVVADSCTVWFSMAVPLLK